MAEPRIDGRLRVMNGTTNMRTLKEMNDLLTTLNNRKPSFMTGFLSGRPTYGVQSGYEWSVFKVNLTTSQSYGSNFTLTNGGIKANKAMKVLVSAQLVEWMHNNGSQEFDISIHKNSLTDSSSTVLQSHGHMIQNLSHHVITPGVVNLNAGDILYFCLVSGAITEFKLIGDNNSTYMTVQEIIN